MRLPLFTLALGLALCAAPPSLLAKGKRKAAAAADSQDEQTLEDEMLRPRDGSRESAAQERAEIAKDEQSTSRRGEDDDEDDGATASLPVVRPRLVGLELDGSAMRRSFRYDGPVQGDTAFPRFGWELSLTSFPLLWTSPGWQRMLVLAASYARETGSAGVGQTDGSTISFPVTQARWQIDGGYAFAFGERVVLTPMLGYGHTSADLQRRTPVMPSACVPTSTQPCFADVVASDIAVQARLRVAITSDFALGLTSGYLLGFGVGDGAGQIGAEASASMSGMFAELGAVLLVNRWLAVNATIPFHRYGFSFTRSPASAVPYGSATDSYYGLNAGVVVVAP
jgi:hypothetical protein